MELRGLGKAAKYYLMIVNMVFVVLAAITVCCIIYGYASGNPASSMTTLLVGASVTISSCGLGFHAARREIPKLLKIYAGIMIGLLILRLIVVVILATTTSIVYAGLNQSEMDSSLDDEEREQVKTAVSAIFATIWVIVSIELILEIFLVITAFYFAAIIERTNRAEPLHAMDKYDNSKI
ncbi:hypothetical protein QE152_g40165 [Popillia japonica]|uniref:Uncharacterized protein n=1 Tax=Popillia japonica TaxID=7064 RepID=A0AAW1HS89_POPJA